MASFDFLFLTMAAGLIIFAGSLPLVLLVARRQHGRREALAGAVVDAIVTSESRKEAEHIVEKTRFALGLDRTTAALQIWSEINEGKEGRRSAPKKPGA